MVTHPFAPVVDENCRTLILGSFPSVKSRENGFYYGHPQNRFWRMLAAVYADAVPVDIARITDRAHITRVLCNGKLAGTLYARHLQPIMGIPALVLPSTSPANAVWTLPKLTDAWRKALTDENATFCE